VVAQLVLPGIAAQRLRDQLARPGQVLDVTGGRVPGKSKLLWHLTRKGGSDWALSASHRELPSTLDQTGDVGTWMLGQEVDYGCSAPRRPA